MKLDFTIKCLIVYLFIFGFCYVFFALKGSRARAFAAYLNLKKNLFSTTIHSPLPRNDSAYHSPGSLKLFSTHKVYITNKKATLPFAVYKQTLNCIVITSDSLSEFVYWRNSCPRPFNKRKEGLHWPDHGASPIEAVP
jgi:hypothetical protein